MEKFLAIMFSESDELAYLRLNVIWVPEEDFQQIGRPSKARKMDNGQPTAIVYRTLKGWQYGVEGKASHGAGHKLCADGFYEALKPFLKGTEYKLPKCEAANQRCEAGREAEILEECFWEALATIRAELEKSRPVVEMLLEACRGQDVESEN
jgi:transketolase